MQALSPDPSEGCVVITRFECHSSPRLVYLFLKHWWVKRSVRRAAEGYVASKAVIDWRAKTLMSISLWCSIGSVYSMGQVREHIIAARLPRRLGIDTTCGIYTFAGDWRTVMFGTVTAAHSPLYELNRTAGDQSGSKRRTVR